MVVKSDLLWLFHRDCHDQLRPVMTNKSLFKNVNPSRAEQRKQRLLEAEAELALEESDALKMTEVSNVFPVFEITYRRFRLSYRNNDRYLPNHSFP